jgi:hypothetical protein
MNERAKAERLQKDNEHLKRELRKKSDALAHLTPRSVVMINDKTDCDNDETGNLYGRDTIPDTDAGIQATAQRCAEACISKGYSMFVYYVHGSGGCKCVKKGCKRVDSSSAAVYGIVKAAKYHMVKDEFTCTPTTEAYGKRDTAQECADACNAKGYREFVYGSHSDKICKCAQNGCEMVGDKNFAIYEIEEEFHGAPAWHLAPVGATLCDYGTVATQEQCSDAVAEVYAWAHKQAEATTNSQKGVRLRVGSGGICNDGDWGDVPLGCSARTRSKWEPYYKTKVGSATSCNKGHQLVCEGASRKVSIERGKSKKGKAKTDAKGNANKNLSRAA